MLNLNKHIYQNIFKYISDVAVDLKNLALTCNLLNNIVRSSYCYHCGLVYDEIKNIEYDMNGSYHINICELPNNLDPFRFIYSSIEWNKSFVTGGWATYLHFNEHRNTIRPWINNTFNRDLDIFYYNGDSTDWYWKIYQNQYDFNIVRRLKGPSKWNDTSMQNSTDKHSSYKLEIQVNNKSNVIIDVVGNQYYLTPQEILSSFDLNPCRVGFQYVESKRKWILSNEHTSGIYDIDNSEAWKQVLETKYNVDNIPNPTEGEKERYKKYCDRGYGKCKNKCYCLINIESILSNIVIYNISKLILQYL